MDIKVTYLNITGNLSLNGEMSADNVTVQVNSHWTSELGILLERGSTAVINNTLFFSGVEDSYFDIEVLGTATITNATFAHINNGLIINSPNVVISDIGIHYCNEYGMQIISSDISITDSIIINNNGADIRIEGSNVVMTDCDFNRSKVEVVDGTLSARGNMVIRVINENSENVSDAQVLVKDLEQSLIYSGATDANGKVTIEGKIFEMVAEGGKTGTFFKTPYTIIVKKDGLSNVSKLRNIGPDMAREEHVIMLREESEWDHVWMTEFRMRIPEGISGAFSSGPHHDGMSFCAHIFNQDEGSIELLLRSYDPVSMENDNDDLFYNAYIYDENGNSMGGPWIGWGVLEIESSQLPAGHYDVIWKYYNDADVSRVFINSSIHKIVCISSDAANVNLDGIDYPRLGNYPININFNWNSPRDIFLRGYAESIDYTFKDISHLNKLHDLTGSPINTTTENGNYLYSNSYFGYYLGNESTNKEIQFDLCIESVNSSEIYSPMTFNIALASYGWIDPKLNDMDCDGIPDYYESNTIDSNDESKKKSGSSGRAFLPNIYSKYKDNFNTRKYDCLDSEGCALNNIIVVRRNINNDISAEIYTKNEDRIFTLIFDGIGYYEGNMISIQKQKQNNYIITWSVTIKQNIPIGIWFIYFFYWKSFTFSGGKFFPDITITSLFYLGYMEICTIFEMPQTYGSNSLIGLTNQAIQQFLYHTENDGEEDNIDQRGLFYRTSSDSTLYFYGGPKPSQGEYDGKNGGINQFNSNVYHKACIIAKGATDYKSASSRIKYFVNYFIKYSVTDVGLSLCPIDYILRMTGSKSDLKYNELINPEKLSAQQIHYGQCYDFTHYCIAFMRAIGIPARAVTGQDWTGGSNNWNYHIWTEAWIPSMNTWYVFDATGIKFDSVNNISVDDNFRSREATRRDYYSGDDMSDTVTIYGEPQHICYYDYYSDSKVDLINQYSG